MQGSGEENLGIDRDTDILNQLRSCSEALQHLSKIQKNSYDNGMKQGRNQIRILKGRTYEGSTKKLKDDRTKYSDLLKQHEMYWKQRAKQFRLQTGDSNTRYFHQCAASRKRENTFLKLKDEQGRWTKWGGDMHQIIKEYFTKLFTSIGTTTHSITTKVEKKVTNLHNSFLLNPFN